ncbi:MAG: DUF6531 domain-containing protein, partial [Prosthecobacter sp.]|nr:DUF6531 domain-containing protein [Prosthecobacter sp.]
MNTPLSKLRWWPHAILLALLSLATVAKVATAHTTSENIINIPLGQEAEFFILADVVEEPAGTAYSLKEILDPTVVSVSLPLNFNQTICGSWRIKGNKIGDTLVIFHWKYKDATHDKEEDEVASVHVIEPNGSAATSPFPATGGDPINTRSGEYFAEEATDLSLGGPMPLVFARYHSSLMTAEGLTVSALGQNRSHNFDWNLTVQVPGLRVRVVTDRGRALHFARRAPGKAWLLTGRTDIPYQLVDSAGVFRLADPVSQRAYTFDGTGKLITIEDGHGNTHTLTYLGSALQSIADGLGRTLNFTYASGKLIKVSDQTTRDVDFGYTGSVLTSATDPLGYVTNYAYDGNLLTSFTRPEGNTPFTQIFTDGKVSSQTERTTDTANLSYDTVTKTTTFTDPIGGTLVDVYAATGELSSHTD